MIDESKPRPLTPADVGRMFAVDPKTVTRWAQSGRIPSFRTPGGHFRFHKEEMEALREDLRLEMGR